MRIARRYTGRHKILTQYRSYHGATSGAIAATGDFRRSTRTPHAQSASDVRAPGRPAALTADRLERTRRLRLETQAVASATVVLRPTP